MFLYITPPISMYIKGKGAVARFSMGREGSRQQDIKIRVAFPVTFYTDLPFMIFYDRVCDGKSQTVASGLSASGAVNSVKTFKNMFLVFQIYTLTGIVNEKLLFPCGLGKGYRYTSFGI